MFFKKNITKKFTYDRDYWEHKPKTQYRDEQTKYELALLNFFKSYLSPNSRILELGCGKGELIKEIRKLCKNAIGVDISKEALKYVEEPKYCCSIEDDIPFDDNSFDFCYSHHVIEHLANPRSFAKELYRILDKGGVAILITGPCIPNFLTKLGLLSQKSHIGVRTKYSWKKIFNTSGFEIIKTNIDDVLELDPPNMKMIKQLYQFHLTKPLAIATIKKIRGGFVLKKQVNSD